MIGKNSPIRLKELRKQNNLTQVQAADFLGIEPKTYRKYENGEGYPKLEFLIMLSDRYNVSIDYILGRSDFTHDGNEYISNVTGLNDRAINVLREVVKTDNVLAVSNSANIPRLNNKGGTRPVLLPLKIPMINFILGSRSFLNILNTLIYYFNSDRFTKMLDGRFQELPTNSLYPADENLIAGSPAITIDSDTNKALAKNLLDVHLNKLQQEFISDSGNIQN